MELKTQKRLAAQILKCSVKRVVFDNERLDEIKESITKKDIDNLIRDKAITKKQSKGVSRARANKIKIQKSRGRRKGSGSRKGKHTARLPRKKEWITKVRIQRRLLKELKEKKLIANDVYKTLYKKVGGGFFRSRNHLKLYIKENEIIKQNGKK